MAGQLSAAGVSELLPYDGRRRSLVPEHKLSDIIRYLNTYHRAHRPQYDKISKQFWQGSAKETAQRLFDFLRRNVANVTESEHVQTIKGPGRLLNDGHGDCKHYASFINGVCESLQRQGYPIQSKFRFTSDNPQNEVHHVFVVVSDGANEYWADPVLKDFDVRNNFYNVKDSTMLDYLSGTGTAIGEYNPVYENEIGKKGGGLKKFAQGIKKFTLKTAIAPARNSFLALVGLNAFNLAHRLFDSIRNPKTAAGLRHKWESMGGNWHKLTNTVNAGYAIYMKHHHRGQTWKKITGCRLGATGDGEYIGVAPAIPALVAMATAIIAAIKPYLKHDPQSDAEMSHHAVKGGEQLLKDVANVAEHGEIENLASKAAHGGGGGAMNVSAGTDDEGNHVVQVNSASHPLIKNAGGQVQTMTDEDGPGGGPAPITPAPVAAAPAAHSGSFFQPVIDMWNNNKGKIITVAAVLVVGKIVLSNKVIRKKIGI